VRFPESKYAEISRLRLRYLVGALARYEVHVARYYIETRRLRRRRQPRAGRGDHLSEHPGAGRGAVHLVNAYNAMGMKELAADAKKVLDLNYPNSVIVRNKGPGTTNHGGRFGRRFDRQIRRRRKGSRGLTREGTPYGAWARRSARGKSQPSRGTGLPGPRRARFLFPRRRCTGRRSRPCWRRR